jgi:arsenite-transporting ATPase
MSTAYKPFFMRVSRVIRLLSFPSALSKGLERIVSLKSKFSGIFQQLSGLMSGAGAGFGVENEEQMQSKLEQTRKVIQEVQEQFTNPALTTFVCVCIPEFLSLYETERLIQELAKFAIDTQNIIVNQVLFPDNGT